MPPPASQATQVIVVGAGMVGISCALALRQAGFAVLLVDRQPPAQETSAGNAGVLANASILPLSRPALRARLPQLFCNRDPKFRLRHQHLPALLPWLWQFVNQCTPQRWQRSSQALANLLQHALPAHLALIRASGSQHLLNDSGWLRLFRRGAQSQVAEELAAYRRFDLPHRGVGRAEIAALEPHLKPALVDNIVRGIWLHGTPSVRNPGQLCQAYFDHFLACGGRFRQVEAQALSLTAGGWRLDTTAAAEVAPQVVVALGAWSSRLLPALGLKNPLAWQRGYHYMLQPQADNHLNRAVMDVHKGFVMTPMTHGIRVTSAVELVAHETPADARQLRALLPDIRQSFAFNDEFDRQPWMGRRPCTADSLPIIGPVATQRGLYFAFGHGHLGFTLGPITGNIIAADLLGQPRRAEFEAFLPARFGY